MQSIFSNNEIEQRDHNRELGEVGEASAVEYLEGVGFEIVMTNFVAPVGRNSKGVEVNGEIDIIALEGDMLCFIEVKARSDDRFISILRAIDEQKRRQIIRTAKVYRRMFNVYSQPHRFDAITVIIPASGEHRIELYKSFWTESSLKKRSWASNIVDYY